MTETRRHFHEELHLLEMDVRSMGDIAESMIGEAFESLEGKDAQLAEKVISRDDELDDLYLGIEKRTLELLALQTPVATDLRLISALLHTNFHLERAGDMAVNIAKIAEVTANLPTNDTILTQLREMADVVRPMLRAAMRAFAERDLDLALKIPAMDDPVDRLNRNMYREVAACADDQQLLEWAVRMMVVSRQLERTGDHAVDIAEQVAFFVTGEFREFTDASHDDGEMH
jgi:phosphate transport system protein